MDLPRNREYGLTGGGLLFWDRQEKKAAILTHENLLQWHSTMALVALPSGKLLGGTTIAPGTGGETKAKEAQLYILDMETRQIEWHEALLPGVSSYNDMILGPDGRVFGVANRSGFFVLDPKNGSILHQKDLADTLGNTTSGQGPRIFVKSPDGRIFVLFSKGIAQLDTQTYRLTMLAESPVPIAPGGAFLDGRIYFGHASHLYSWDATGALPPAK